MTKKDDGGQAFPNPHYEDDNLQGMTLRDYFAAKAMQGMLTADWNGFDHIAVSAYRLADAMIAARGEA